MNETKETENDDGVDTNHDTDYVQEAERNEGGVNEDGNNEESEDDEDVSNCSDKEESQLNLLRKKFNSKRKQV